ncbi:MAG: hypothetical protein QOJ83_1166 [Frankiales bacterium]|jgi:hypothetical protein|nr:hypothetical protein [Frankiales bacterium]
MTIVQISCPECSTRAEVPITGVLLVAAPETDTEHGALAFWICQGCRSLVGQPVGWVDFARLASAGAQLLAEEPDQLPPHPESPAPGPTWAYDDVLDLHLLLNRPDWFLELERLTPVTGVRP